jgi:hypothetical protein
MLYSLLLAQPIDAALKAQYTCRYIGPEEHGKGSMNMMVEESTAQVVIEFQEPGERFALLLGYRDNGHHLRIPRQGVDQTSPSIGNLPLPFLPNVGRTEGLVSLLKRRCVRWSGYCKARCFGTCETPFS